MTEPTLESLAARVAELERQLVRGTLLPEMDWRSAVGTMADNEFTRNMLAAIEENSEAERRKALEDPE